MPNPICSLPECQTTAGCMCNPGLRCARQLAGAELASVADVRIGRRSANDVRKSFAAKAIEIGLSEALSVARGEQPAAAFYHQGHKYVPVSELDALREENAALAASRREMANLAIRQQQAHHQTVRQLHELIEDLQKGTWLTPKRLTSKKLLSIAGAALVEIDRALQRSQVGER